MTLKSINLIKEALGDNIFIEIDILYPLGHNVPQRYDVELCSRAYYTVKLTNQRCHPQHGETKTQPVALYI